MSIILKERALNISITRLIRSPKRAVSFPTIGCLAELQALHSHL